MYSKYSILEVYICRVNISPGQILVNWGNLYAYDLTYPLSIRNCSIHPPTFVYLVGKSSRCIGLLCTVQFIDHTFQILIHTYLLVQCILTYVYHKYELLLTNQQTILVLKMI